MQSGHFEGFGAEVRSIKERLFVLQYQFFVVVSATNFNVCFPLIIKLMFTLTTMLYT